MPSPACQVRDGAGAYTSTTNGKDVTPGNSVVINLLSSAGVSTWEISCITTDELSDAAAVTAALVVDNVAKTATFTAPVAGRAYRFQSRINSGVGPDGTAQASYTTTFGIYTLVSGRRVHAVDETFESHATFGWVGDINSLIRTPPDSTFSNLEIQDASSTHQFVLSGAASELAADRTCSFPLLTGDDTFVFAAHAQTLTNKTLTSAVFTTPKINDTSANHTYDVAVSELAANRTITLPLLTGNDTFVFADFTQTLTNKTLTSAVLTTPRINDASSDHRYIFAGSELAADRTVTLPLLTGGDTFVFQSHTQTLSNKTLASPTITGTPQYTGTRCTIKSPVTEIQTSATTQVNCGTYTLTDDTTVALDVLVWSTRQTSNTKRGRWKFSAVVSRSAAGGAVLDQLEVGSTFNLNAGTVTCDVNGNDFRVRVAPADTDARNWFAEICLHEGTDAT